MAASNGLEGRPSASRGRMRLSRLRVKHFLGRRWRWIRQRLSPRPSPSLLPPPVTFSPARDDSNAIVHHVPSRFSACDGLPPPSPHPSQSRVAVEDSEPLDGRSSIDPSPVFTSNGASMVSPADTALTTPLRPSCPDSPRDLPDDGEAGVPQEWEDGPKTRDDESAPENFRRNVYLIGQNLEKIPMRMSLDTQSTVGILARDKVEKLGLPVEKCDEVVCLLTVGSEKNEVPVEGQVQVDWHFSKDRKTYTSTFRVVAMTDYDVLLGLDDIVKYQLVQMSKAVPCQEGEVRRPRC